MSRFFFNVYDGVSQPDPEGADLPDIHSVRAEAIRFAGELIKEEGFRLRIGEDWHMDVTDESGLVLFGLDFTVIETPATMFLPRRT